MSFMNHVPSLCLAVLLAGNALPLQAQPEQSRSSAGYSGNDIVLTEISELRALRLLLAALEESRVNLHCLEFATESFDIPDGAKSASWNFAARESHSEECGGDREFIHTRDRYLVKSNGEVFRYDVAEDEYREL
jgi:hypothetical protein